MAFDILLLGILILMNFRLLFLCFAVIGLLACNDNTSVILVNNAMTEPASPTQVVDSNAISSSPQSDYPYEEGNIPAKAWLTHGEIYNPEAVIPPQCYTKTQGKHNPCYACHQSYPRHAKRPNTMSDGRLQGNYEFSDVGMTNSWKNLFVDRSKMIAEISDAEINTWINQDNYSPFIEKLAKDQNWQGELPAIQGLARPDSAFEKNGVAKDGSHWVAFNYKPFPSTFWPTNGSTGDAMIRLPTNFRETNGHYSWDVYFTNLTLVEMAVKGVSSMTTPPLSEKRIGVDLNGNNLLEDDVLEIISRDFYVGDAADIALSRMLYPQGTEFLHTVRYLGVDADGRIYNAPRMKEVRYMRKNTFMSKERLASSYMLEAKEKMFEQLPRTTYLGDEGISNGFGWVVNGYIEDEQGHLRPQHQQELAFCNGCHKTVGSTYDQTFSFPRKVEGAEGWGYINLKAISDVPTRGEDQGEFLTYFERVGGGDEFRQNAEMLQKWFNTDGSVKTAKVTAVTNLYELIMPSPRRALDLNKAYKTIVDEQSYIFGRDATIAKARNVLSTIDDSQPPLLDEFRFKYDIRLDWHEKSHQTSATGTQ